jgi:hypothetical protein
MSLSITLIKNPAADCIKKYVQISFADRYFYFIDANPVPIHCSDFDPYNSWSGNAYLQPSLTRSVEISYSFKGIIHTFIGANKTANLISRLQVRDTENPGIFT